MTEEKKFEKWLRKYLLCNDCNKKCTCIDTNSYCEEQVKQAYLVGLHEGQLKWHKVADGDLPPKKKPVLCYLFNESYMLAFLREDNVWTTNNHNAFENVHAWCEIPQFKE